jgi:hypothetical protein
MEVPKETPCIAIFSHCPTHLSDSSLQVEARQLFGATVCSGIGVAVLNKQKYHFFFFYKIREQEVRSGPTCGCWYQWERDEGKGCGRVNIVQILCIHVCKWKNYTC